MNITKKHLFHRHRIILSVPIWICLAVVMTIVISSAGVPSSNKPGEGKARGVAGKAVSLNLIQVDGRKASSTSILARLKKNKAGGAQAARAAERSLRDTGFKVTREYLSIPRLRRLTVIPEAGVKSLTKESLVARIKKLRASGLYEYVEPDWQVHLLQTPTDAAFTDGTLWGLRNQGQSGGTSGVDVNAVEAWNTTTGSPSVTVAVVDTGVRYTHQDLSQNMWVNTAEIAGNNIDDDNNGYVDDIHGINAINGSGDPMDDNDHGSHCAGTIAASGSDSGRHVGVAYNVKVMALKFLAADGSGATSDAIACIDYAVQNGAHVLSNSWGGGGFSQAVKDAVERANAAGIIFVAAAGNSASDNDATSSYPANYNVPNVVSVAAIDRRGRLASFSSYGATSVDIAAPGVDILSCTASSDSSYSAFNGTSMATPHVSGVAALLVSRSPGISVVELKNRLLSTAAPLPSLSGRVLSGGMVDAGAALNASEDGVLEVRAYSDGVLRAGEENTIFISVSDLAVVTNATVEANFPSNPVVSFLDNGVAPDAVASDGVYTGRLIAPAVGSTVNLDVQVTAAGKNPASQQFAFNIASPPANDPFLNRIILAAGTTQTSGSNIFATSENLETANPSVAGGKTVWWLWSAASSGSATISTTGSSYDTTLAIYSGDALGNLTLIGANDDTAGLQSAVTFNAVASQSYLIQVDGYSGAEGDIQLNYPAPGGGGGAPAIVTQPVGRTVIEGGGFSLSVVAAGSNLSYQWKQNGVSVSGATHSAYSVNIAAEVHEGSYTVEVSNLVGTTTSNVAYVAVDPVGLVPDNDDFGAAQLLAGSSGRVTGTNIRATGQGDEPNHAGTATPLASVWYAWTAPSSGILYLDAFGSDFDTVLAVYTGGNLQELTEVQSNDDSGGLQSAVSISVSPGVTYWIAVDGSMSSEGQVTLNYTFVPNLATLPNDLFSGRVFLGSDDTMTSGGNIGAGGETGEPNHAGVSAPLASAWWSWRAPADGTLIVSTAGSNFDTVLAVYTGSALVSLAEIVNNDDAIGLQSQVTVPVLAGTTYAIAVDGYGNGEGDIELSVGFQLNSGPDHGDSIITATPILVNSTTTSAFEEGGDEDFFKLEVPAEGILTVNTLGSSDTIGALFSSTGSLLVQSDDVGEDRNFTIQYHATPGTYYVRVRAFSSAYTGVYQIVSSLVGTVIAHPGDPADPPLTSSTAHDTAKTSKYSGFLTSADGGRVLGYFKSIKVSKTGKLSARMYFGNVSYALKGLFDQNGQYSGLIMPRNGSPATVELQLVTTPEGAFKVEGSVIVDNQTAYVTAVKAGSTSAYAGAYTLLILGDEDESAAPQGHGYGMMTVTSVGTAKIKGLLGDGSKWTTKCFVAADGEMPVHVALYRKAGALGGMVRFRDEAGVSDCDGEMHWLKPAGTGISPFFNGFDLERNLVGSRFVNTGGRLISSIPNGVPNSAAHVGAGSAVSSRVWSFQWTGSNKIIHLGPEKVKVRVKTRTGQIKGSATDIGTKWKVGGVVFQKQDLGAGMVYVKRGEPRSLVIVPN